MSKIDDLIKQYCPNGVEYKELGNIVNILDNQRRPVAKEKRKRGNIPYYGANGIQDWVNDYIFDGTFLLVGEDGSVINKDNTPVLNWAIGKIWVNNHAHILSEKIEEANLRYVYFILSKTDVSSIVRGVPPKLNQLNLKGIKIPVPPMPVQEEIVRVLNTFTALEAELEAELEARKRQYEYYRNKLLTFDENTTGGGISWKMLSEVCTRQKGTNITASEMKKLDKINAPIKIFAAGNTSAHVDYGDIPDKDIISKASIIVKSRGNIGFEYYDKPFSHKNEMWSYSTNNASIDLKFVYYFLSDHIMDFQIKAKTGKLPQISTPDTDKFLIPIPPLDEQGRIVAILDKFDSLVNDISEGLPAELNARRQQYEYYRNKLLTFTEMN